MIVFLVPMIAFCLFFIYSFYVFTQPLRTSWMWHKIKFLTEFNRSEIRDFLLLDQLPYEGLKISLPYYLSIAGGRIIELIPFPRVLVLCEMQKASSRVWTRVAVFISYNSSRYTTSSCFSFFHSLLETPYLIRWSLIYVVNPPIPRSYFAFLLG